MSWSDRQIAMLREMGVRLWPTAGVEAPAPAAVATTHADAQGEPPSPQVSGEPAPVAVKRTQPGVATDVRSARPEGVQAMDWTQLRAAVAGCTACGLCSGRRNTVFGVGNERARWMIIGEAPGEQEDARGEPFVGKAGQLLDAMLASIELTREEASADRQVFIANVLKCRPPMNRNPQPEEIVACEPFLKRQVALVQPSLILAMGRFAVQSLLQTQESIGRLRGRVHRYEDVPVIVTYHPAYLLRNPLDKARSWEDLCFAVETMAQVAGNADRPGAA